MREKCLVNAAKLLARQQSLRARPQGGRSVTATSLSPFSSRGFSYLASSSGNSAHQEFEKQKCIHHQQLRFRRHDRASAFNKPRPPTKKKRREYNRRMKKQVDERARHSAPGSKAGPRRQWAENRWQQLLAHGKNDDQLLPATLDGEEYTYEDAILEDLMSNTSYLTSQPTPEPVYLGNRHRECVLPS